MTTILTAEDVVRRIATECAYVAKAGLLAPASSPWRVGYSRTACMRVSHLTEAMP